MTAVAARVRFAKARQQIDSPQQALLFARMVSWAWLFRVLKRSIALPRLVRLARWRGHVRSLSNDQRERVVILARWASRPVRSSSRGNCLERALVTYRYLTATNADPTLMVGFADGVTAADRVRGHAWVAVNGQPIDETDESLSGFQCIVAFRADGSQA
jgi:Transglutaminase-like superfamily